MAPQVRSRERQAVSEMVGGRRMDGWSEVACSLYLTIQRRLRRLPLTLSLAHSTMAKQGENEKRGAFALGGIIISSAVSQQRGEGEYNLDSTHTLTCVEVGR